MDTYTQIHDFTGAGAERFAAFVGQHSAADINPETLRMACLGVLEDNLNGVGGPLVWELSAADSRDGQRHTFTADFDEIIVEDVQPDED